MIYKLFGWSLLIAFVVYRLNIEKNNKENYKNKELKDHGVGTFSVFNTQTIINEEDEEDYSHLDKEQILDYVNNLKEERELKFNEYISLVQAENTGDYTKRLEKEIDIIDINITKFNRIYYKISLSKKKEPKNEKKYKYKFDDEDIYKKDDETLFKFPMGNLLPISDNRNLFENRIQSFNTDIKIINTQKPEGWITLDDGTQETRKVSLTDKQFKNVRIIHELDNKIFNDEFQNIINKKKKDYYDELLDYEKIYDNKNKENINNNDEEEKGLFRKKKYENVNKKDINLFTKIGNRVLKEINNSNLKTGIMSSKFIIVQKKINYILYNKKNTNELVYDGDIVIYRDMKNHGKHIGFKVLIQNNNIYIIDLKIKGIVTEDKIHMYISSNEFENNLVYYEYDDKYVITVNPREDEVKNMSYMEKIGIMRNRKKALRLDRGTQEINDNMLLRDFL